jgi:hypothetical protein
MLFTSRWAATVSIAVSGKEAWTIPHFADSSRTVPPAAAIAVKSEGVTAPRMSTTTFPAASGPAGIMPLKDDTPASFREAIAAKTRLESTFFCASVNLLFAARIAAICP